MAEKGKNDRELKKIWRRDSIEHDRLKQVGAINVSIY